MDQIAVVVITRPGDVIRHPVRTRAASPLSRMLLVLLCYAGISLGAQPAPADPRASRDLLRLSDRTFGAGLPNGWQARAVRGERLPSSVIIDDVAHASWQLTASDEAGWFTLDQRRQPLARDPRFILSSRLLSLPADSDLAVPDRSDSPLRFFVILRRTGGLLSRPRMLMYSFGRVAGSISTAKVRPDLCDVRISRPASESWQQDTIRPLEDATNRCNWTAGPIEAVGFLQDTNQTRSTARAEVRALMVIPPLAP